MTTLQQELTTQASMNTTPNESQVIETSTQAAMNTQEIDLTGTLIDLIYFESDNVNS